jgi:hypothetical protein
MGVGKKRRNPSSADLFSEPGCGHVSYGVAMVPDHYYDCHKVSVPLLILPTPSTTDLTTRDATGFFEYEARECII